MQRKDEKSSITFYLNEAMKSLQAAQGMILQEDAPKGSTSETLNSIASSLKKLKEQYKEGSSNHS